MALRRGGWVLAFLLLLPPQLASAQAPLAAPPGPSASFRLRPGDALRLAVKDEPLLGGDYPVNSDGTVLLPLIGVVRASGVVFDELERRVRAAYETQLAQPVLVLSPLVRVAVLGEVRLPGLHLLDGSFDVMEALARAGGLTASAARDNVLLLRDGGSEHVPVIGGALQLGEPLRPGDQLVVGRRSWVVENAQVLIGAGTSVLIAAITTLLVR